ncbi:glucuronyl esterase domain-containing protein [Microlunatus parietis]
MPSDQVRQFFADRMYGDPPANAAEITPAWRLLEEGPSPDGGLRRQVRLDLTAPKGPPTRITLLIHLPDDASAERPAPCFLGMNFTGNHACTPDPAVLDLTDPAGDATAGDRIGPSLARDRPAERTERGEQAHRFDFAAITGRGYASVTWCYRQLGPDTPEVFATGPHRTLGGSPYQERRPTEWGAIGIWAWTMSRVLDALEAGMVPEIDPARVIAHGHSRLGKTALFSGACEPRWAAVISNDSGCTGAASSRAVGETPQLLADVRPYWYTPRFQQTAAEWQQIHNGAPREIPDQADLLALVAPRPLYVASASDDPGADPEGEFLSWQEASASWPGGAEATAGEFPLPGTILQPDDVPLGYHLRDGGHDVMPFDWAAWLDFADRWVR